jgi:hypothetical protein
MSHSDDDYYKAITEWMRAYRRRTGKVPPAVARWGDMVSIEGDEVDMAGLKKLTRELAC